MTLPYKSRKHLAKKRNVNKNSFYGNQFMQDTRLQFCNPKYFFFIQDHTREKPERLFTEPFNFEIDLLLACGQCGQRRTYPF